MEQALKQSAFEMLEIVFDEGATKDEIAAAATTLVEAVAPDVLEDSIKHVLKVYCEDCGKSYSSFPLDVVIPDEQWRAIGFQDEGGILCAACIVNRGARLTGVTVAKLVFE